MTKEQVMQYVNKTYQANPAYLWQKDPNSAVFRHSDNAKWYGLMMQVSRRKLGQKHDSTTDILVLKGNADEIVHIREMEGFAPAYHMNKKHWFTVILEDIANAEIVYRMLDKSYDLTK